MNRWKPNTRNNVGKWGEDIAARFLEEKGWYIRHRNWRHKKAAIEKMRIMDVDLWFRGLDLWFKMMLQS